MEWHFEELEECESTFNEARRRPAWWVVSARRQAHGRGRFNRTWYGEEGGLWATYNVPIDPKAELPWGLLPLVAGAAIMRALSAFRIEGLRLRWPNDVLVGRAKLAGILVERPSECIGAIGIGINVFNDIAGLVGRVQDPPARLADVVRTPCPAVAELRLRLAEAIGCVYEGFVQRGYAAVEAELAQAWGGVREVEIETDSGSIFGAFTGIVKDGSPVLRCGDGSLRVVPAIEVNRMKERS